MNVKAKRHETVNRIVIFAAAAAILGGCAGQAPAVRFDAVAREAGFTAGEVAGDGFRHRTYSRAALGGRGGRLHIYIGGDGTPFPRPTAIAADPTPRRPLTLSLMQRDPHPAVLVGRPCYHGLQDGCHASLWTLERYSKPVVDSMAAAIRRILATGDFQNVVLIGYSGGGVLGLLLADRMAEVDAVVTLAANLDTEAWTSLHGYTPLAGSLNPAAVTLSRGDLFHLHYTGTADDNVPPAIHRALAGKLPAGSLRTVAGFDHRCCWVDGWPGLLAEVDRYLSRPH